jgi:soluble lytic murein transglycosylase-like protein
MNHRRGGRWARAVVGVALALAGSASADDALVRRIAALHALMDPGRRAAIAAPRVAEGCDPKPAWRTSEVTLGLRIRSAIRDASLRFAVPKRLIESVIQQESAYDPDAVSYKGAMGLMQLMPATARELGVRCPFDPRENVLGGTRYLRALRDRLGGWPRAVAAYHAGPARIERGGMPGSTRRYLARVLRGWNGRRAWRSPLSGASTPLGMRLEKKTPRPSGRGVHE